METKNTLSIESPSSPSNDDFVLTVSNLTKIFGNLKAVDNLSFSVRKGEIYGLLGPNGAGKTTTIKSILGLLTIEFGSIDVLGQNPLIVPEKVKENIGYVGEEPNLFESLSVRELFNFIASIRKLNPAQVGYLAQEYLESLDALQYYNSLVATLSRGNKQKIQIISALLHKPALLILDEPLTGLDARSAAIVKKLLQLHIERGGSILLSTHILEQAQNLCTQIGIINQGKLVASGTFEYLQTQVESAGASLEQVFLSLTKQDEKVDNIINHLQQRIL